MAKNQKIELVEGGRKVNGKTELRNPELVPEVRASDLMVPPNAPPLTEPKQPKLPDNTLVKNVAGETQNIIAAQTQEAADLKRLREENAALYSPDNTLAGLFQQKQDEFEIPETVKELKDINLRLTDADTASKLQKSQIRGAGGQTYGQAQREVTQEDQEAAIRSSGLAARAAVLQGNLETASALATQAVNIAYQDRTLQQQNLLAQLDDLSGVVDAQTQQLVDQAKAEAEAEITADKDLKANITAAILAGASQAEIAALTASLPPNATPEQIAADRERKNAAALGIAGVAAREDRNLDRRLKEASLASSSTSRLLSLAGAGDPTAIKQLGFDPRSVEVEVDATTKRQLNDAISSQDSLLGLAEQYKGLIDQHGYTNTLTGNPEVLGQLRSLRALMTAEYKKAATLGTLDTGVLTLMDQILGSEPTSTWNPLSNITGRRGATLSSQLDTFIQQTAANRARDMLRLGLDPVDVDFSVLSPEEDDEINSYFGGGMTTTTAPGFNPASYFNP